MAMLPLLLTSVLLLGASATASAPTSVLAGQDGKDIDAKIAAAGKDVAKLLELAKAHAGGPGQSLADKVYERVLELDPENEVAHKALRHLPHDGKWFENFAELTKYKRDEEAKMKAKGLARYKDSWMPERNVPFLKMEWLQDERGTWVNPLEAARRKQVEAWQAEGYQFRADDNSWIAPADIDKWVALLWKCGEEWLDTPEANAYHATLGQHWELAGEHFTTWTTCDWDTGNTARWHADQVFPELVRVFGTQPESRTHFVVLNSLAQYNQAAGNQGVLWESEGFSSLHGAYFADCYFDLSARPPQYVGCGVSYWDHTDPKMDVWGPYWARWAAAQSFIDAIDRSWIMVSDWISIRGRDDIETFKRPFWEEKRIPRWLRYGAAAYVERFMKDPLAGEGDDPWNMRKFAFSELAKSGGLRKLDDVLAFKIDAGDMPGSLRLFYEAGLLVSFLLDGAGGDKELAARHGAFQKALKSGVRAEISTASNELQQALSKREGAIRKFAGL